VVKKVCVYNTVVQPFSVLAGPRLYCQYCNSPWPNSTQLTSKELLPLEVNLAANRVPAAGNRVQPDVCHVGRSAENHRALRQHLSTLNTVTNTNTNTNGGYTRKPL